MGMITLCMFLLLAPMGGALGVVFGNHSPEVSLDIVRVTVHPKIVAALNWAAPIGNETTTRGVTTAASSKPTEKGGIDTYIVFFLIFWIIIGFWYCYNMITPLLGTYPVRPRQPALKQANKSSMRSQGCSAKDRRQPVVAARRARSGKLNNPTDDLLDLYQDLA